MALNIPKTAALEAKAEIGHPTGDETEREVIAGVNAAFAAYREANDQRIAEIERRSSADVLLEEKVARIDAALEQHMRRLDRALIEAKRPGLSGAAAPSERERKTGFDAYMRRGETSAVAALEGKQLSTVNGADGGFVAPAEVERAILERLSALSPMRQIATVRAVSGGSYRLAVATTSPAVGWVAETAARPQTDTPDLAQLNFPVMELYAQPAATQALLDDAVVDIDAWVAGEVETVFAEQESTAFITGNGTTQPLGVLSAPVVADASWSWGNIGVLNSGAAGAFPAANPSDVLVDLVYALRAGYRQNGSFMMNRRTQSSIRKFKDTTGAYLWAPPASLGQPATLMNFPVVEMEAMPNIAANSVSILFGDFRRGYLIVDRMGVRILRDPFSAKPFVLFYTTKRVGGGVQDFAAIKGLRFAA